MSSWLWYLNTRQYQRRYNKDPTTNPGTLTTYYVCSVPGLDAASSCTLLEQYIKCSCYYFGVTLDSPLALLGILTDLKIMRIVQIIVRKSEMKRDFLVLVLSGTHILATIWSYPLPDPVSDSVNVFSVTTNMSQVSVLTGSCQKSLASVKSVSTHKSHLESPLAPFD